MKNICPGPYLSKGEEEGLWERAGQKAASKKTFKPKHKRTWLRVEAFVPFQ